MRPSTAWHAEFVPSQVATAKGAQDGVYLSAKVWPDPHAAAFQCAQQLLGKGGTKEYIDA